MEENGGIWTKVFESKDAVETADLRYVRVPGASFRGKSHVQFRWIYKADWEKGAAIDNITVGLASKAVMVYTAGDKVRVTTDPNNPSASTKECTIETVPGTLGSEVTAGPGEGAPRRRSRRNLIHQLLNLLSCRASLRAK